MTEANPIGEDLARDIEAIAGRPQQIKHPVLNCLSHALSPLMDQVNQKLADDHDTPFEAFSEKMGIVKQRLFIMACAHFFPSEVESRIRLITARPPENVHRMQRTDPYWVGDFFSANMIVHALQACDLEKPGQTIVDIGCSSGSLVRVLAAYDHSWEVHGCDPIDTAIDWASKNVTTGHFSAMDNDPPFDYNDGQFDGATAISVWSHHRADAAQLWINEVARILKPGGWFAVTFSSLHHVRWQALRSVRGAEHAGKMLDGLEKEGTFFVPVNYSGEKNDTGSNWGQAAYARERFFAMFRAHFEVAGYFPGLNQGNQDLVVFRRRAG